MYFGMHRGEKIYNPGRWSAGFARVLQPQFLTPKIHQKTARLDCTFSATLTTWALKDGCLDILDMLS